MVFSTKQTTQKMKIPYSIILILCTISILLAAGPEVEAFPGDGLKTKGGGLTIRRHQSVGGMILADHGVSNITWISLPTCNSQGVCEDVEYPYVTQYISMATFTYENKFYFAELNDFMSFAFAIPARFGFSLFPRDDGGLMHIKIPLIFDINFFHDATEKNKSDVGFHFGFGPQLTYGPLIAFTEGGGKYPYDRAWINFVIRGGIKAPFGTNDSYVNVSFGPALSSKGNLDTQNAGMSINLTLGVIIQKSEEEARFRNDQ